MERTVTIRNKTRDMLVLNLPAAVVPEASSTMQVGSSRRAMATVVPGARPRMRPADTYTADKRVGGSLTLLAKGTKGGGDVLRDLPMSVRKAPEVVAALTAKPPRIELEVVIHKPEIKPAPLATSAVMRESGARLPDGKPSAKKGVV